MIKVAIVTGSTRPGRNNEAVARWVFNLASERKDAYFELVDIAEYRLPLDLLHDNVDGLINVLCLASVNRFRKVDSALMDHVQQLS